MSKTKGLAHSIDSSPALKMTPTLDLQSGSVHHPRNGTYHKPLKRRRCEAREDR